jgi:hypothetical protein
MVKIHSEGWIRGLLTEEQRKGGNAVLLDKENGRLEGGEDSVSDIQPSLRFSFYITSDEIVLELLREL